MKLKITVHGVAYEVDVEVLDPGEGFAGSAPLPPVHAAASRSGALAPHPVAPVASAPATPPAGPRPDASPFPGGDTHVVASPIAGTIIEVKCKPGETVQVNDVLLVIEAMKMNTSISAPVAGRIKTVHGAAGDTVREGQILVEFE